MVDVSQQQVYDGSPADVEYAFTAAAKGRVSAVASSTPLYTSVQLSDVKGWAPYHAELQLSMGAANCTVPDRAGEWGLLAVGNTRIAGSRCCSGWT